jgi:AcrR family transcriptional regulator
MVTEKDSTDRRSRILEAAAQVISERGVDGARLADIAEAADVSLGLVQHYFRHRDRLLAEVFRREEERISERWSSVVDPSADPLERLVDYLRLSSPTGSDNAVRAFQPGWSFWLEFWSKANRDERIRAEVAGIYESFGELFRRAIADGVAQGMFELHGSVEDVADRIISEIDGTAIRTLLGAIDESRMLTLLVDGLCTELGVSDERRTRAHERAQREAPRSSGIVATRGHPSRPAGSAG